LAVEKAHLMCNLNNENAVIARISKLFQLPRKKTWSIERVLFPEVGQHTIFMQLVIGKTLSLLFIHVLPRLLQPFWIA